MSEKVLMDAAVARFRCPLDDAERGRKLMEHNFALAPWHFSCTVVEKRLREALEHLV